MQANPVWWRDFSVSSLCRADCDVWGHCASFTLLRGTKLFTIMSFQLVSSDTFGSFCFNFTWSWCKDQQLFREIKTMINFSFLLVTFSTEPRYPQINQHFNTIYTAVPTCLSTPTLFNILNLLKNEYSNLLKKCFWEKVKLLTDLIHLWSLVLIQIYISSK